MVTLRSYQKDMVSKVLSDWKAGFQAVLLTAATGAGKTLVFLTIIHEITQENPGARFLILAHRKELIEQPLARLYSYYPEWNQLDNHLQPRAGVVMAESNQPAAQLVVATVQSLASASKALLSKDKTRLDDILHYGAIDYVITDECHHATADTYLAIYAKLKEANPNLRHLGVTATPMRSDGDGLAKVYQKESAHYGIVELIKAGYLAPVRWLAIQTKISLKDVASRAGDFVAKQLANVYEVDNCLDLVVATHQQYAHDRQAIAFTVSVEGAYRLAEKFRAAGFTASAADGTTEKGERARILSDFANGKTQVLCNVGLYTEGLDVPQASCIHQVRPTQSDGLYIQMIGRALRTYPGKVDALVLDYAPKDARNIAMMGDVLGCPVRKDAYTKEDAEEGEVQASFTFDGEYGWREGSPAEIIARQLDYLDVSPWSWYRAEDHYMSLGLGETLQDDKRTYVERTLVITPPDEDGIMRLYGIWQTYTLEGDKKNYLQKMTAKLIQRGSFDELSEAAEGICNKYGNAALAAKARSWRKTPASDGQIAFARRLKCYKPGMTKGAVAQAITHSLALRALPARTAAYA